MQISRMDRNTRRLIIGYVRKYDEYKKWFEAERDRILFRSQKQIDGMPRTGTTGNPTLEAAEQLEKLEQCHKCAVIRAIDNALFFVAANVDDENEKRKTRNAIWLSCINSYEYPFEIFAGNIPYERAQFYRIKNDFLNNIKIYLGV